MTTVMRPARRSTANITPILQHLLVLSPSSVLDVGAGYGMWGFLLRQELDHFFNDRRIDGLEPDRGALNSSPAHHVYNTLLAVDFLDPLSSGLREVYDVTLMDAYLDRVSKPDGIAALEKALRISPRVVLSFDGRSRWAGLLADFVADRAGDVFWTDFSGDGQIRGELWRPACDA